LKKLNIIDRRSEINFNRPPRPQTIGVVIHHTAGSEAGLISTINNTGNGYHYAITSNGDIWYLLTNTLTSWHAGRTTSPRFEATGLAPSNPNNTTIAIAFIGNFSNSHPTQQALNACDELIDFLRGSFNLEHVYGHVCVTATACPGQIDFTRWRI
jgi:N-acetyl-anhydromuramyl-L-alanine amidase AmpD